MLNAPLFNPGLLPPATWRAPIWQDEGRVAVKSERLGEGIRWFFWSPEKSAGWREEGAPDAQGTHPPSETRLTLTIKEGRVTLRANDAVQPLPFGDIKAATAHPSRPWVALVGSSYRHPPQPAVWDLENQRFLTPLMEVAKTRAGESLSWQAADGFPLHGIFYPHERAEAPLSLLVHDGPIKAACAGWPDKAWSLNAAGAHVFYVNYRGSEGLSVPGPAALEGVWGEKDADDLLSAKNHLVTTGKIASKRFALWGGRAGGFTVLNAITRHPQAFDVAIAVYPLLDPLVTARRSFSQERAASWSALMGGRPSALVAKHIPAPKTKLRLYHGKEDEGVLYSEIEKWARQRTSAGWDLSLTGFEGMGARFNAIEQWRQYHQEAVETIVGARGQTLD